MLDLVRSPLPPSDATAADVEFVCLDIETSGLDVSTAELLSVGWVLVKNGRIPLASAKRLIAKPAGGVGQSAAVHGLTDTMVADGLPIDSVIDQVVAALRGRVLVVHHAGLDKGLLDRLCKARYGCMLPVPVLDTLALALKRQRRRHHEAGSDSVRLVDLRRSYGLPAYGAHDCLVDALSTGELLLAMLARDGRGARTPVWPWLS